MKTVQPVPLSLIDFSDETYSVNFMPNLTKLRSSIETVGLIQPVLLRRKRESYQIVCGFRRLSVLKEMGAEEVLSRVEDGADVDELGFFLISLHDNLITRGFNTIEKAIVLDKLIHRFGVDRAQVLERYLPLLGEERDEKILSTYLSIIPMQEETKRYILREQVSRNNIRRISALPPEDRLSLLSMIAPLKLGESRLREMLTLLEEIRTRDGLNVREIAQRSEILAPLSNRELTASQRTERVKKALMALRYPMMEQLERAFEAKRKGLHLPSNVSLDHPPYFEGKGLRMAFEFETLEQYRSILSFLEGLLEKKEFQEMVDGSPSG